MNKITSLILITLVTLTANAFSQTDQRALVKDMVKLDKTYIPALMITGHGPEKMDKIIRIFSEFEVLWNTFYQKYPNGVSTDWSLQMNSIDQAVTGASLSLKVKNKDGAHQGLEKVREAFLEARKAEKIEYYLDYLTLYHTEMEYIVRFFENQNRGVIGDHELANIKEHVNKAVEVWGQCADKIALADVFELKHVKKKSLIETFAATKAELTKLQTSLEKRNVKEAVIPARVLKPLFIKTLLLFGNMPSK